MYKLSVPIMNHLFSKHREAYLRDCRQIKAERVFLITPNGFHDVVADDFRENIDFLKKNGIEPAIWLGYTLGHGGPLVDEPKDGEGRSYIRTHTGKYVRGSYCPLDEAFTDGVADCVRELSKTGVKTVLLDDDFRMSQRGDGLCCCCERHMEKMSAYCGEEVTLEKLRERAFVGGKNVYRDAWLKAQGDGLREFAKKLRAAADGVDGAVTIGLCSAYSPWNADGADPLELTKILAGENAPLLRLHGAPYWAAQGWRLTATIETARTFVSFCKDGQTELFAEGDAWPRPRYQTSAAYLQLFDAALRADGAYDGVLKYVFDYFSSPDYERGYVERHARELPSLELLGNAFSNGKSEGVRVYVYPHTLENAELRADYNLLLLNQTPYLSGDIFAANGISTVYEGEGLCGAAFGENVKYIPESALEKGLILDGVAAKILTERGVDVGLRGEPKIRTARVSTERDLSGETVRIENDCPLLFADYAEGVRAQSFAKIDGEVGALETLGGREITLSYRYENANGQRFFVLAVASEEIFSHATDRTLTRVYLRQKQLAEAVEWISGNRLPALVYKEPELYTLVKRKEGSLLVAIFNCFADGLTDARVCLDRVYSSVRPIVGGGIRLDGDGAVLESLPAYSFIAFELFE